MSLQEMEARERTCAMCHERFYADTYCPDCIKQECVGNPADILLNKLPKKESEVKDDDWKCRYGGNHEFVQDTGMCQKCGRIYDSNLHGSPTHTVELTEEEQSRLVNIIGASYTSNPFNPLSDTGKRWMAFHDTLIAKLCKPKKESVEFEVGGHHVVITKNTIMISDLDSQSIGFTRKRFERIIAAYKARKDEVG